MPKIVLIKNARVFAPEDLGVQDVLVAGEKISQLGEGLELPSELGETIDASGAWLIPGLVDSLVHIAGGGGEGGFASRTPELDPVEAFSSGVTTVVGVLGTDATTRTLNDLYGKFRALCEQGLSCYMHTGSYEFPVMTVTGSVRSDIVFMQNVIGVGELAISDHRSSQPRTEELVRVASDARVAGLLSGKKGVLSIHVGDGKGRLDPLFDALEHSDLPAEQFYPTHINRNRALLAQGIEFAKSGGYIDFTASTTDAILESGEVRASHALKLAIQAGVPVERIIMSSDGQGSLPDFCENGLLKSLDVASVASLFGELRRAVQEEGVSFVDALRSVTSNPATVLGLGGKGGIAAGLDADLSIVDPSNFEIRSVMARGNWQYLEGKCRDALGRFAQE
ncbi:beta-aspartyl-peptidase [Biformimicrobium ophioploci]|uniref:Isoaspartyl dipeptidase n=1 Tax=Biformimicrobium ophioploci TaxID=3036711 RepID=A0ABQ6LZQ3_9GAMM|nr:beta-aspartyl-peptidase [Microbulbifer sp. NKW57]GMG87580.1 beta-aspartyl-peptidase [Microbulbifer sp. NKW57]